MPRTALTPIAVKGPYPTLPIAANSLDIAFVASDTVNLNSAAFGIYSRLLVLVQNANAGAQTFTITSAPDTLNRTGDVTTYSLAAGEFGAIIVTRKGWQQTDGALYFAGSHADVKFAIIGIN